MGKKVGGGSLDLVPLPEGLLPGVGYRYDINRMSPTGEVASGKLRGFPFWKSLTATYWEMVTITIQLHNEYKERCPLGLFNVVLVYGQCQSPSRI